MEILGADIAVNKEELASRLSGPLSELLRTEAGIPIEASELEALFRDPDTKIEFPALSIIEEKQQGLVRVRVVRVRVVRVRTAAGGNEFVWLVEEPQDPPKD